MQMAALIDIVAQRVVTIVPDKQTAQDASKSTVWTFEDRRITIASIDGITEEFPLEGVATNVSALAAGGALGAAAGARRLSSGAPTGTAWAPWNDPVGMPRAASSSQPKPARTVQKKKKPKNIFELLFN
jgi:hypothetical protein